MFSYRLLSLDSSHGFSSQDPSSGGIYADSVEGVGGAAFATWLLKKGVFPWGYREVQCGLEKSLTGSTSHPGCGSSPMCNKLA